MLDLARIVATIADEEEEGGGRSFVQCQVERRCGGQQQLMIISEEVRQVRSLMLQAKHKRFRAQELYSAAAAAANATKPARELLRKQAQALEARAEELVARARTLTMREWRWGNEVMTHHQHQRGERLFQQQQPHAWLTWLVAVNPAFSSDKCGEDWLQWMKQEVFEEDWYVSIEHQANAVRAYFDPTKHTESELLHSLLASFDEEEEEEVCWLPAHMLAQSACYTAVVVKRSNCAAVVATVSYESDFVARGVNRRLKKRNQTWVLQHSFSVAWFDKGAMGRRRRRSRGTKVEGAGKDDTDQLRALLKKKSTGDDVELLAGLAEDVLFAHAFLSQRGVPNELDDQVLARLLPHVDSAVLPRVQYPGLFRWAHAHRTASTASTPGD